MTILARRPFVVLLWVGAFLLTVAWDRTAGQEPTARCFMPGSQPGSANLESVTRWRQLHGGYAQAVEPALQLARLDDESRGARPALAGDSDGRAAGLGLGTRQSERGRSLHPLPYAQGWLGGRSDPTNTTALTGSDFEGVTCDFCHRSVDPFNALRQGRGDVRRRHRRARRVGPVRMPRICRCSRHCCSSMGRHSSAPSRAFRIISQQG